MRRPIVFVVVAVAAATAAALFTHAGAAGDTTRFRTPDAGAACKLESARLVCSSLGSSGSVALRARGAPSVVRRLPWWDASEPVLDRWRHGSISCVLSGTEIRCRNGVTSISVDAAGFSVAL